MLRFLSIGFTVLVMISCDSQSQKKNETSNRSSISTGTQQILDSLNAIYERTDFKDHPYQNEESLTIVEQNIADGKIKDSAQSYLDYALLLMRAGKNDRSIAMFRELIKNAPNLQEINDQTKKIYELMAVTYMRKGEIDNCVINHNAESCLFPIKGAAIHTEKEGSQGAIEIYKQILAKYPDDYQSRWLINVAYMTLDQYPEGVPPQYLITPDQIEDDATIPEFANKAMDTGIDINELSGSSILEDMDNDGDLDLVASAWDLKGQLRYFENENGKFVQKTEAATLEGMYGGLNIKQTDYDNDGFLDLWIMRGAWRNTEGLGIYPNSLLKNNGDGTFTDVTIESGLYSISASQASVWVDLDNDGWLDLYIANESPPGDYSKYENLLYYNNGDGTFSEIADRLEVNFKSFFKGVASADYDNDGDQDLYLSNLFGDNILLKNLLKENGQLSFVIQSMEANVAEPKQSFPCWFFDYDNDGHEDLYVSAYADFFDSGQTAAVAKSYLGVPSDSDVPRLYHNNGDGTFTNETVNAGLDLALHTMGCNYEDINNDGYLDFYLGTGAPDYRTIVPNRLFLNQGGKKFADVTTSANVGNIQKGHGISIADIDNDGDQDIYAVMGGAFSGDFFQNALFVNPGNDANWAQIKLVGSKTNTAAIGSKIKITITENGKQRYLYRTVSTGSSFGANSLIQEIGIGNAKKIDKIEVRWANGSTSYIDYGGYEAAQRIIISEGEPTAKTEAVKALTLSGDAHHHHHH